MDRALHGLRVLDVSRVQAGPSCAQLLGFLGADVIKVEDVDGGDPARLEGPRVRGADGAYFAAFNGNKRAITLNLKTDRGRELFGGLAEWADVVVESFSKGVMERLGLGYETLRAVNPRVVHASVKGFGEYGPNSGYAAYELSAQAAGGLMAANGADGGPPMNAPEGAADSGAGLLLAVGILAALRQRDATGVGQHVEVSLQDGVVNLMRGRLARAVAGDDRGRRRGSLAPEGMPSVFPCAPGGFDDYVMINLGGEHWEAVLAVMGRDDLMGDERYATDESRGRRYDEVKAIVSAWTSRRTKAEAFHLLAPMGVWCGPVLGPRDVLEDDHLRARRMVVDVEDPARGGYVTVGCPIKMESSPVDVTPAPLYDQHTREVLSDVLGLDGDAIAELRRQGVTA